MDYKFFSKIKNRKFSVCVIGLGYVGLPLISKLIEKKINVYGIDKDERKISLLKNGLKYIKNTNNLTLKYFKKNPEKLSKSFNLLSNIDVIIICLPTPLKKNSHNPDMSYIYNCAKQIKKFIKKNHVIILESTVYPGATRNFLTRIINNNIKIGENFFIGYSPERENPGDKNFSYDNTPKVVSGYTPNCRKIINLVYSTFVKKIISVEQIEEAELSKLLENLYRAVNIGLVNEMKIICDKLNIDIFNTIEAAATKNFGFQKFLPGPGLGGHCIPIDPFYLSWISKKNGYDPKFIKLAGKINSKIPQWTVKKVFEILKYKKNIKILLLGISYKKNIDDDRESPSFEFMKILKRKKINFDYNDPYFPKIRKGRNFHDNKKSIKLSKKNLQKYSAVILLTDHNLYNYKLIAKYSKLIIDTRGKFKKTKFKNNKNIIYL